MAVLITRPRHDVGTHYLYHWSLEVIREAKRKTQGIVDLAKGKAKRDAFQSYLKKDVSNVVIVNGHGNENCFCGHEDQELISVGGGDDLFKGKNLFVRSCSSGAVLGKVIMSKGAKGFVGYTQPYIIPHQAEAFHDPMKDEYAGPILECSNQVAFSLVRGKTAREAHEESLKKYEEKIDELLLGESVMTGLIPFLQWNRDFQVCYQA